MVERLVPAQTDSGKMPDIVLKYIRDQVINQVRVADYASGDGTTDDTTAIEAASTALQALGGGTLRFGPATKVYKVSAVTLKSNITYQGEGATLVGNSATTEGIFQAKGLADGSSISDTTVTGFRMDGGGVARRGVFLINATYCRVRDNRIYNLGGSEQSGVRLHQNTTTCWVQDNHITMGIDSPFGTLAAASGVSCVSTVPDSQGGGQNATLTFGSASNLSTGHTIQGNTVINGTHGVLLSGATDCVIDSNQFASQSHRGVIMSPIALRNTVSNNRIREYGSTGIHLAWGSRWNVISGNNLSSTVSNNEGNGIKGYYGCSDNTVTGNIIDGTLYGAVRFAVGSSRNVITGNRVNNAGIGVHVQSQLPAAAGYYQPASNPDTVGNVVTGNTLSNCGKGVELESSANASVRNTTLSGNLADSSSTASYSVAELTTTSVVAGVTAVSNVSTGTTTNWVLPRGERHFAHKTANTGLVSTPQVGLLRSGAYYQATPTFSVTTSNTLGNGVFRCAPMHVSSAAILSRVGLEVTAVGDSGSTVRLGIYADDGNGYPKNLVADLGTVPGDAVAVAEVATSTQLDPGTYWVGAVVQGVTTNQPTLRSIGSTNGPSTEAVPLTSGATPAAGLAPSFGFTALGLTGALPATFPTAINLTSTAARVFTKIA